MKPHSLPVELMSLSLVVVMMTLTALYFGTGSVLGILAIVIQAGLLVRINHIHRHAVRKAPLPSD